MTATKTAAAKPDAPKTEAAKAARYLMDAAIEGGINYWAEGRNFVRDINGDYVSFECRDSDPDGTGERVNDGKWVAITEKKVLACVKKIVSGEYKCNSEITKGFAGKPEDWDYDAWGADAVIQFISFGELVFG